MKTLFVIIQILTVGTFVLLSFLIWRVGSKPGWRVRAIIYGWAAMFVWALVWSVLLPGWLKGRVDPKTIHEAFPEGTWAGGALVCGWFWPALLVELSINRERRVRKKDGRSA